MLDAEREEDWARLTTVNEGLASRLRGKDHEIEQLERALKDIAAATPDGAKRLGEQQAQVKRENMLVMEKEELEKRLKGQIETWAMVTAKCEMLDSSKQQLEERLKQAEMALASRQVGSSTSATSSFSDFGAKLEDEKKEVARLGEANRQKEQELAEKDKVRYEFVIRLPFVPLRDFYFVFSAGFGARV